MAGLLAPILFVALVTAIIVVLFPGLIDLLGLRDTVNRLKSQFQGRSPRTDNRAGYTPAVRTGLYCRILPAKEVTYNGVSEAFSVEICGAIRAPSDSARVGVRVRMTDVTEGGTRALPVHARTKQWQADDSPVFCYCGELGKVPRSSTTISDWMPVAKINCDWLAFPRKGTRTLRFSVTMVSSETSQKFANSECNYIFDNDSFGYADLQENIQQAKTLAVALAFAVSAADKKLYDCEVDVIKDWARGNIDFSQTSDQARQQLEGALDQTVDFFRAGHQINSQEICREITEIVPVGERCRVLELCLRVVRAKGSASSDELGLLKKLADWLEVDAGRFRTMTAKILPVNIHEVEDAEVILGVTSDMDQEATRQRLNEEYRKWNARVTSSDPEVQMQADLMLKFIAEARNQYVASGDNT
jgi:hypothetical protein